MAGSPTNQTVRLRRVERVALAIGLALIAIWGSARIYQHAVSRSSIAQFRADQAAAVSSAVDPAIGSRVDFRLWSSNRITAYQQSLVAKTDRPAGILSIPKIHLEAPIFDGTDELTLNRGVGRISGTARIGEIGNVGIAGHRDGFFRGLKDVRPGDVVELELPGRTDEYVITQIQVVKPEDTRVLDPTSTSTLTMVTCFPFYFVGSAPERYIVTATLRDSGRRN